MLNRLEGPVWVALGIGISLLSYRTGIGSFREPGAGFVSLASGLFLLVVGAIMIAVRKRGSPEKAPESRPDAPKPRSGHLFGLIRIVALLFLYAFFLETLGYVIATFLAMVGLFYESGRHRLAVPVLASFICVAATYTVFEIWLRCRLPRGIFPWW